MPTKAEIEKKACELYKKVYPKSDPYQYLSKYNENFEKGWKKIAEEVLLTEEKNFKLKETLNSLYSTK